MASKSEIGHIKNVANLNVLTNSCIGFGPSYNPTNSLITVAAQQALYPLADSVVTNTTNLVNTLQQVINTRVTNFAGVPLLATRIMLALNACGADAETIKNAETINRKIQGRRAKPIADSSGSAPIVDPPTTSGNLPGQKTAPPINVTPPVTISVSQQSFDRFVSNLKALINYVSQVTLYHPNETDLQVTSLTTYLNSLIAANNAAINAHVNLNNALVTQTKVLYDPTTGLVQVSKEVKKYVASVFGPRSMQAKQVNKIEFRTIISKPRKKKKK